MLRVYIAGALNGMASDYIKNMHRMIKTAEIVRQEGVSVYIPGLDFLCGVIHGYYEYDDYFGNSQPWLEVSDCLFLVPGWEESAGTAKEIKRANELGIPVIEKLGELVRLIERKEKEDACNKGRISEAE